MWSERRIIMEIQKTCCCTSSGSCKEEAGKAESWIIGFQKTSNGSVPLVSSCLTRKDRLGSWKARWGFNRMHYRVQPGLYGIGNPTPDSEVFVTANYKMSFDKLRKELDHINGWILILDTKGINVWCAAGKGTFGTEELINRIHKVQISQIVRHKRLILPQLGAVGVAAHVVKKATGFSVIYGPVEARNIRPFLKNRLKADRKMRQIPFNLKHRLALIPMEFIPALKFLPVFLIFIVIVQLIKTKEVTMGLFLDLLPFFGALIVGSILFQILLPWLPSRSFSLKGWLLGMTFTLMFVVLFNIPWQRQIAYFLLLPTISSYLALNFTGSTTFTSQSGVKKELSFSIPLYLISLIGGIIFYVL